jgi:hypothetical protein
MNHRLPFFALAMFLFISTACNMPGAASGATGDSLFTQVPQTLTAVAQATGVAATPTAGAAEPTAASVQPLVPLATATSLPCNQISFVSDVTYPDNTAVLLNQGFTKTWRLKNTGSCTWTSGYQLVFDSGDQMGGNASQQLTNGTVAPGQNIDVSVNLTAPGSAGTFKGNWRLREPGGALFGLSTGPFWVQIQAVAEPQTQWPLFKIGDSGPEVRAIQLLLQAHGANLNVDGDFGPITQTRVKNFQSNNGLAVDGIVGPQTWSKLIIQVKINDHGTAVRAVQTLLKNKFGYNLNVDGIFGPETNNAVKDFQDDYGLAVDGIVGPNTWKALISE